MKTPVERRSLVEEPMQVRAPCFIDIGFGFHHNQACAVYYDKCDLKPAVITGDGVFQPSWKAQAEGWQLVKCETHLQVWCLTHIFKSKIGRRIKLAPTAGSRFYDMLINVSKWALLLTLKLR